MDIACTAPEILDPKIPENNGRPETRSPDYTVSDKAGRYGIYPVKSRNILVDRSESIGASDAGIYIHRRPIYKIKTSPVYCQHYPDCHCNKYKFDDSDPANLVRLQPLFGSSCIGTNTFSSDSLTFTNFNGLKGVGAAIAIASGIEFKARIKSSICVITAT
jgi:hypothetical protein